MARTELEHNTCIYKAYYSKFLRVLHNHFVPYLSFNSKMLPHYCSAINHSFCQLLEQINCSFLCHLHLFISSLFSRKAHLCKHKKETTKLFSKVLASKWRFGRYCHVHIVSGKIHKFFSRLLNCNCEVGNTAHPHNHSTDEEKALRCGSGQVHYIQYIYSRVCKLILNSLKGS